jgi:hypothetical protein
METKYEEWCIVELYGHNRIAGLVSEQVIGGAAMVRVDVPEVKREADRWNTSTLKYEKVMETVAGFTKFFGAGAIYAITPTTQEIATAVAERLVVRPVSAFELPQLKALNEPDHHHEDDDGDEEE